MPKRKAPRRGSMQYWPRKRSTRIYARVRSWNSDEKGMLGFAGYKAGMTHVMAIDTGKHSHSKGASLAIPCTVVECPPLKIASAKFYKKVNDDLKVFKEILFKTDKELDRKIISSKKPKELRDLEAVNLEGIEKIQMVVYTQPKFTGLKKKPELFEMALGGSVQEQLDFIKSNIGKEMKITDHFKEGELVDLHAITKGKGFQGPVKRFGVDVRVHKSEKTKRGPGSLGPWKGQQHIMYRIAHAGQMGFHQRTAKI